MKETAMREAILNIHGDHIADLDFHDNGDGTDFAHVDDGTITRRPNGSARVRIQDRRTGKVTAIELPDVASAFYSLGISIERCNGINGWLEMALMPGSAGRD